MRRTLLEQQVDWKQDKNARKDLSGRETRRYSNAGGEGGNAAAQGIQVVTVFPDIPNFPTYIHYQAGESPDETDQVWYASPGFIVWIADLAFTIKVGTPGTSP